jgi:3-hydroxymyristoyl/3-hydroxydecanoyl-(acyl carrier protein) dehydratase
MVDTKIPPAVVTVPAASRPLFDRAQLEHLATGRISEVFGPRFAAQDGRRRQTRLPAPPMLLVDRVTAIDAPPAVLGTGVIHTETDVAADSWYLDPAGRMPTGVLVEAGQADLLLISWMGIDLEIGADRVYRLLGCELTYHGELPRPGETLRYEIRIDGHAEADGVRLMFFHYDCYSGDELRLTMRGGQAGFFTDGELAASTGVQWDPAANPPATAQVDPPAITGAPASFGPAAVRAFAAGDPATCFGAGWRATRSHVRTPRIAGEPALLRDIPEFDPRGGPWGRGYLRARTPISGDEWFFAGHFSNDPCMPGTLMLEGGIQAMAFFLAALGYTADRDGWRFEPVPGRPSPMQCRAQVTPGSRLLTYELFVVSVVSGPEPTLVADLLCTVDGVPAFHAAGVGLRLVPDWPLEHWRLLGPHREQTAGTPVPLPLLGGLAGYHDPGPVARIDGLPADFTALLASAWGRPSAAFGPQFAEFDRVRRCPRLPGPPYHFVSRLVSIDATFGKARPGSRLTAEYDVPAEAWFFEQNSTPVMPFAVLTEVVLQPCGWLATYVGGTAHSAGDLLFRNLDGDGTVFGEVRPGTGVMRTETELLSVAEHDGMVIESFAVTCTVAGATLFTLKATFGFFPPTVFADQVGLPPSPGERTALAAPGGAVLDLRKQEKPNRTALDPPGRMLRMLDRITGYWPDGGPAGLGRLRAEKDVDPGEWYFRAHFFQDPVQPGSLGAEAVCQLLQHYLVVSGRTADLPGARFEPVLTGSPVSWKYRGQVVPADHVVTVELDITEAGTDDRGRYAIGQAWLWVDGRRIYHLPRIGVRAIAPAGASAREDVLDPAADRWLGDHRPLWTQPVAPFMSVVDLLARGAAEPAGPPVRSLHDVRLSRWLVLDGPVRTRVTAEPGERQDEQVVTLSAWRHARVPELSRFETSATALVRTGEPPADRPRPFGPLSDARPEPHPYRSGGLFHGRAFHYLTECEIGADGASGTADAAAGTVPPGLLHQGLLDAALHVIPHHRLRKWSPLIGEDQVSFPHRLDELLLFEPLPRSGTVRVEARFAGFADDDHRLPKVNVQLLAGGRVAVSMRLVLVLLSVGRLSELLPGRWHEFVHDRRYCAGAGLSATEAGITSLNGGEVTGVEWLPGFVARVYGLPEGTHPRDHLAKIAVKDHVGRRTRTHPSAVVVADDLLSAFPEQRPGERYFVRIDTHGDTVAVRTADRGAPGEQENEEGATT